MNKTNKMATICMMLLISLSCSLKEKKTTIEVTDPDRHYHSVLRGQTLDIVYEVENTGPYPLFIDKIHTTCGCLVIDNTFKVLPAKGKGFIKLKYDSSKNIGYVKHYITIMGNLESGKNVELTFDLNVVPNALYTKDYEQLYEEKKEKGLNIKDLVDGNENNLGYYLD